MDKNVNKIEKYYMRKGKPKIDMNQNAARDANITIKSFRAGIGKSIFTEIGQLRLTGEYIAEEFLQDNVSKIVAEADYVSEVGSVSGYIIFLQTVEEKIKELLGEEAQLSN